MKTNIMPAKVPRWKRALDLTAVILAAPLWLFLCLGIAIGIKIVSRGPAIFKQERLGLGGHPFRCLKFRTMKADADDSVHHHYLAHLIKSGQPITKLDLQDNRLIPGAWLLRSCGLDELPQLINVLRGDMSLVGPRPCLPYENERFAEWHRERCHTPPGLTGLWQVSGKNNTTFEEMMHLDIRYVRTRSFGLDLKILAKTFPAVFAQVYETKVRRRQLRLPQTTHAGAGPRP